MLEDSIADSAERQPTGRSMVPLRYGSYPLHKAAELGDVEILNYLLYRGYSANDMDHDNQSALHVACNHGQVVCAEILIKFGASIEAMSIDGSTPLCDACASGSVSCVQLLMANGADVNPGFVLSTPLHEACLNGSEECVSILIEAGARLNVNDCNFGTPLHAATIRNHPDCVRRLLQAGAAVNAAKIHQTALHIAAVYNHFEIGEILLEYGANVYASNNQNRLAIDLLPTPSGPFHDLLKEYASQPRALKEYCRRIVRSQLVPFRTGSLENLGLPKSILAYLSHL